MFGRSRTAREVWLQQPAFLKILNHFLRTESIPYNDSGATIITTDPILSVAATLDIGPGVQAQSLHRDDFIWQQTHEVRGQQKYRLGSDFSLGLLVPGVKVNVDNGATLVGDSYSFACLCIAELILPSLSQAPICGIIRGAQSQTRRYLQ